MILMFMACPNEKWAGDISRDRSVIWEHDPSLWTSSISIYFPLCINTPISVLNPIFMYYHITISPYVDPNNMPDTFRTCENN